MKGVRDAAIVAAATMLAGCGYPGALKPEGAAGDLLIRNVRVLTMTDETPRENWSVYVSEGRVAAVGPEAAMVLPAGLKTVDGEGRTLMPGLVDMHVHVWDEAELAAYLAHGVTTVRNLSGMPLHLDLRKRIAEGRLLGPDITTTGPILNSDGPNAQANHKLVETAEEARAAVRRQHAQGFRHLKVYSNLRREAYEAILDEARALDMTVSGHTPEGVRGPGVPYEAPFEIAFAEVLDDGFVTIEHAESIVWHALYDDLDTEKARALAKEIAAAGVAVDPTLLAHHALVQMAKTDGAWAERDESDMTNPFIRLTEEDGYAFWAGQPADVRAAFEPFYFERVRLLHAEGVTLVAGTDAGIFTNIPGSALTRELELLVAAGLTPFEALETATVNAGRVLGNDGIGRVAPGAEADFVLLDDDPLTDVSAVEHPAAVVLDGRYLDADKVAELHEAARDTAFLRSARRVLAGLWAQR